MERVFSKTWALLLIRSFKALITELKDIDDVTKRISVLEDINAASKNTTYRLKIGNERHNNELIKLQD